MMRQQLTDALKASTADYAEIRIFVEEATHMSFRCREAERTSAWTSHGGLVRACKNGGWGMVSFDTADRLDEKVREACRCAALVGRETTRLATVAPFQAEHPVTMKHDFRGVSLDAKIRLVQAYNQLIMKADPAIQSSWVGYDEIFRTVYFASTDGTYYMEERPKVSVNYGAKARNGSLIQQAHDSVASTSDFSVVLNQESNVQAAADRAVALLKAPPCEAGVFPVILDQLLAGVFVHEAFGHLSEADFLYENPRMRELMHLGREMGGKDLNIVDDGTIPNALGTQRYDDEGVPTRRVPLITAGVLSGHLHSRQTAGAMNEAPTGNARSVGKSQPPIVRMRNTCIENGTLPVAELFRGIERGVYACDAFGGQTEFEMFTFSAGHGYRIENGEKGELIRDVVLTGNVFETLKKIDATANDFQLHQGAGGCGKGGQAPLAVTHGSPHIRIRDVVVGGK